MIVVIVVVVLMWTVPFLVETLSLENIRLYLHNIHVDPCYTKPTFLGQVAGEIVTACSKVDALEERFYTVQYQTRDANATANQYRDCDAAQQAQYDALDVFANLENAALALNHSFNATVCGQDTMRALSRKFAVAPGKIYPFVRSLYRVLLKESL